MIGLVEDGDRVEIDIPNRRIEVMVSARGAGRAPRRDGREGLAPGRAAQTQDHDGASGLCLDGDERRARSRTRSKVVRQLRRDASGARG